MYMCHFALDKLFDKFCFRKITDQRPAENKRVARRRNVSSFAPFYLAIAIYAKTSLYGVKESYIYYMGHADSLEMCVRDMESMVPVDRGTLCPLVSSRSSNQPVINLVQLATSPAIGIIFQMFMFHLKVPGHTVRTT